MLRRALAGAAVLTLVVIALPRAQQAPAPAPTAAQAGPSSKIWIGHEAEYEEFLRTAKIAKSSEVKVVSRIRTTATSNREGSSPARCSSRCSPDA